MGILHSERALEIVKRSFCRSRTMCEHAVGKFHSSFQKFHLIDSCTTEIIAPLPPKYGLCWQWSQFAFECVSAGKMLNPRSRFCYFSYFCYWPISLGNECKGLIPRQRNSSRETVYTNTDGCT